MRSKDVTSTGTLLVFNPVTAWNESAKLRVLRASFSLHALCLHEPYALCALVPHVPCTYVVLYFTRLVP